jgi:hypothetical protein
LSNTSKSCSGRAILGSMGRRVVHSHETDIE